MINCEYGNAKILPTNKYLRMRNGTYLVYM
jgi:hypothetical protein